MRALSPLLLSVLALAAMVSMVPAQPGLHLNFQGRLLTAGGTPIATATTVNFKIYRGGSQFVAGSGTLIYEENTTITPDGTGIFNHAIGRGTPVPAGDTLLASELNTTEFMFVEISVGGAPLLPRASLTSGAYSAVSALSTNALGLGGLPASSYLTSPLTSAEIGVGTVVALNLAQSSVTGFAISNETITGADVLNGSLTGADIANGTLTGDDIMNSSVTGEDILNESITSADILAGSIQGSDMANGAVTTVQVLDGTLTGADIQDGTVLPGDLLPSGNYALTGNLSAANLSSTANTVLGDGAGDTLTINAGTIIIPNATLSDDQVSDTLTVGPAGSVDDAALSPAATLLGQTIELASEVSGELSIASVAVPGETVGDLLFYDGATWARVPAGAAGQLLQTQGASASPPVWVDATSDTQSRLLGAVDLNASTSGQDLQVLGSVLTGVALPLDGAIVGLAVTLSAPITAGQATFEVTLNSVGTGFVASLSSPESQSVVAQLASPTAVAAGDLLGVQVSTDAGFAPDGLLDVAVDVITAH